MLLTISIPTYNRSKYLERCLDRILICSNELSEKMRATFQVFVSDNSEDKLTSELVKCKKYADLNIIYQKNKINIGSDANIAKCLCYPKSKYVMLLGDDDFLTRQSLMHILSSIVNFPYSFICMNFYGLYKHEERKVSNKKIQTKVFKNGTELFKKRNIKLAFISGLIFRRDLYEEKDVDYSIGSNLVHFNLVLFLIKQEKFQFLLIENFLIEVTRNNTGGYNPIEIFYSRFWELVNIHNNLGIKDSILKQIKRRMLNTFYIRSFSTYIRYQRKGLGEKELALLDSEFLDYKFYKFIYRKLFRTYSNMNFLFLTMLYIIGTAKHNPKDFLKILKHIQYAFKA